MTAGKHTAGPWTIQTSEETPGRWVQIRYPSQIEKGKFGVLAELGGWGTSLQENMDNARLIAAAPDMLAALQSLSCPCLLNGAKQHFNTCKMPLIEAAIKKAAGVEK